MYGWPVPRELVRVEPHPGISVLAPTASLWRDAGQTRWGRAWCQSRQPEHVRRWQDWAATCGWDNEGLSRSLRIAWTPEVFDRGLRQEEMLELLVRDLANGTPRQELKRLGTPWAGWEWHSSAQGNMLRDRWVLVGTSVVFLQAVSLEDDPFPEAELFFESLSVAPTVSE